MKRHLLFVMLALLVGTTAMAQVGNVCVYWDVDGTIQDASGIENGNAPQAAYTGYVIVFVEDVVSGASFGLNVIGTEAFIAGFSYPEGLHIGDPLVGGVEIGMTNPEYGFLGTPVIVAELVVVNAVFPAPAHIEVQVTAHPAYGTAVYANGNAEIGVLDICQNAVGNEDLSFSGVKALFR